MNSTNGKLSIVAFYLSEYDIKAVEHLGYKSRNEAFKALSRIFGKPNNYLKLRRDEFDALPESSSTRRGYANRPAAKSIVQLAQRLRHYSFGELSMLIDALIANEKGEDNLPVEDHTVQAISEEVIEQVLNATDENASVVVKTMDCHIRRINTSIIHQLKRLYAGRCQICGHRPNEAHEVDICEAHHISPFSISHNNNASNIIILCPNHHRIIHKMNPYYDANKDAFIFSDGVVESVSLRIFSSNS